jgi:hypothetical protein
VIQFLSCILDGKKKYIYNIVVSSSITIDYKGNFKMSMLDKSIKTVEKVNNSFLDILDNSFVKYGFLIFVILRIIFITDMEDYYLNLFNYPIVKIGYALVIAYSACFDPVYAVALTTLIIITIQELYRRQASRAISGSAHRGIVDNNPNAKPFMGTVFESSLNNQQINPAVNYQLPPDAKIAERQAVTLNKMPDKELLISDAMVFNEINKHALQRTPDPKDTMIAEFDFYEDPAYRTITANLENKNYLGNNKFYVTDNNLEQIQTNQEPGVNQNASMQAFPQVQNIQGLPNGFDKGVGGANLQLASVSSP